MTIDLQTATTATPSTNTRAWGSEGAPDAPQVYDISFKQTGTGAVSRTATAKAQEWTSAADYAQAVDNVAALRAINPTALTKMRTLGYYTAGDGGDGLYWFNTTDASTDNGGTVIAPTAGTGRWNLVWSNAVNAAQFGAKGDGATDNTTAIQNADTALSAAGGGYLLFNAGTFISGKITKSSFVTWIGVGADHPGMGTYTQTPITQLKLKASTNDDFIYVPLGVNNWAIENLTLDGNKANQTGGTGIIRFQDTSVTNDEIDSGFVMRDATIQNGYANGIYVRPGFRAGRLYGKNYIVNNGASGLYIETSDWGIYGALIGANALNGIGLVGAVATKIEGCDIWNNADDIRLTDSVYFGSPLYCANVSIIGCEIDTATNYGIFIEGTGAQGIVIGDCTFYGNSNGNSGLYSHIGQDSTVEDGVAVHGCSFGGEDASSGSTVYVQYDIYVNSGAAVPVLSANMYLDATTSGSRSNATIADTVVGVATYDLSTASGTQIIDLPWRASAVQLFGGNTSLAFWGVDDGTQHKGLSAPGPASSYGTSGVSSITLFVDSTNFVTGYISAISGAGFTITWTKTGAPTGTAYVQYTASRW